MMIFYNSELSSTTQSYPLQLRVILHNSELSSTTQSYPPQLRVVLYNSRMSLYDSRGEAELLWVEFPSKNDKLSVLFDR
jgi:hypothetical protein